MTLSPRILVLQDAMDRYGNTTIKNLQTLHAFGDSVLRRLIGYLGDGALILGVPPRGDFDTEQGCYGDEKFSTFRQGLVMLEPVQMGVAIGIPHKKDDGTCWLRIVLEFELVGDSLSVRVGDDVAMRGFPLIAENADLDRVCAAIFEYATAIFEDPVRAATAVGTGRFGFV